MAFVRYFIIVKPHSFMITYSIIQKSQLEGVHRLDAEYYQPEYLEIAKILQSTPHKSFNEVVSNITNGAEIREYVEEDGLPYLRVSDIKEFFIDSSSVVHISKESKVKQNIKLRENDILLSRSGSLAIAAVVTPDLSNSVISSHLMRIPTKGINPYFLVAFLNSKFGKEQIMQRNNGTIVPEINHPSLKSLLVPILSEDIQKETEKIVRNAYEKIQESNKIYSQAEDLLLEELELKDFEIEDDLSYIVNLSETKFAHRADAEYFQPKYDKLIGRIKSKNAKMLGELASMKKGIEPGAEAYQGAGRLFIRVSSLSKYGAEDKDQKYLSEELYQKLKNNHEPKVGEILLTKDATPGIAYVVKGQIEGIISSGILRLKVKDKEIENEYLALCLNSVVGQMQAERDGGGSIITHWRPEQVKSVFIPILQKSTQQKIADLVQKSHEARKNAKELLEEAKRKVEELIESK